MLEKLEPEHNQEEDAVTESDGVAVTEATEMRRKRRRLWWSRLFTIFPFLYLLIFLTRFIRGSIVSIIFIDLVIYLTRFKKLFCFQIDFSFKKK